MGGSGPRGFVGHEASALRAREDWRTVTATKTVRWLAVREVAQRLSMDRADVYRLIKSGELRAKKISPNRTRVSEAELVRFMETREDAAPPENP